MTRVSSAFDLEPGELDLLATAGLAAASAARSEDDVEALMLAELPVALWECVATGPVHVLRPVAPAEARRLAERLADSKGPTERPELTVRRPPDGEERSTVRRQAGNVDSLSSNGKPNDSPPQERFWVRLF